MSNFELLDTVATHSSLGEGVLWNNRQQNVWWTDILEARLYQYDLAERALKVHILPERLASFGFTEHDSILVCAFTSGFALYEPGSQKIDWLAQPELHLPGHRFNDGRVDRQGRFWAGTMVEQEPANSSELGSLYRLTRGECKKIFGGIRIPNSICWSADSREFYFADSTTHRIHRYQFDAAGGLPANPEIFASTTPPYGPDGSTIDAQGFLWNAQWGSGKVTRYDRHGTPVDELQLPVSQTTCVAFGGSDMNLLFVTSARVGLTADQLDREPQAGNLFIYRTPYQGLAESRFKI